MGGKCIYLHFHLLQVVFDLQNGKFCDFSRFLITWSKKKCANEETKVFPWCHPWQKTVTHTLISICQVWPLLLLHFSTIMLMLIVVRCLYCHLLREKKNSIVYPLQPLHGNALILHFFFPFSFLFGQTFKKRFGSDQDRKRWEPQLKENIMHLKRRPAEIQACWIFRVWRAEAGNNKANKKRNPFCSVYQVRCPPSSE